MLWSACSYSVYVSNHCKVTKKNVDLARISVLICVGRSMRMTSAPKSDNIIPAKGAGASPPISTTLSPESGSVPALAAMLREEKRCGCCMLVCVVSKTENSNFRFWKVSWWVLLLSLFLGGPSAKKQMPERQTKATQERHERMLLELLKEPGNDRCADCRARSKPVSTLLCSLRCNVTHTIPC